MQISKVLALPALALCLLGGALSPCAALEAPTAIRPTWGVVIESLLDPSLSTPGSAIRVATPSINFNLGAGVVMPLSAGSRLAFEPSADIYYFNAEYSTNGQALPTDNTYASAFVLGLLLDAPLVYSLPLGDTITIGGGIGLCLDIRAAITTDSARSENTPFINRYFWDKARFLTPSMLIRGEYRLTDRVGFGFSGRMLWPTYNLWSGEGFGFFDQAMYLVDLTIRYGLQ